MSTLLQEAYAAENFRRQGYALIDRLTTCLQAIQQGDPAESVIHYDEPGAMLSYWQKDLDSAPNAQVDELFEQVLGHSIRLLHPRYLGHQISPPAPVAALAGLLGDFVNNGMGVYEMGIAGTTVERLVIQSVARQLGFTATADGVLTSGGTLANLTALLAARSLRAPGRVWSDGADEPLALMVSAEAHYCVDRAARIMGWGTDGIVKVPVDEQFRMRTDLLETCYEQARQAGRHVIAVVGSACTTATGSFDDLPAIADFCAKHQLWFHVDGAHGAALAFSDRYRPVVAGIERADSVVMDFHKMLLTPSITTALIFQRGEDSFRTFAQEAEYLFERREPEWFNLAKRTFECTKLMIGLKVYSIIRTYGLQLFDEYVTYVCDLGKTFARLILERPNFQLAVQPQCNIVCYRYQPPEFTEAEIDQLNQRIRRRLLEVGDFYIVQAKLKGQTWLRSTLTNPFSTEKELTELLNRIEQLAAESAESSPDFESGGD